MKLPKLIGSSLALALVAAVSVQGAQTTRLHAVFGGTLRIEGTSNIHNWRCRSPFIGGQLKVSSNFPLEPGMAVSPAKVPVNGLAWIMVRSLKSLKEDGTPYSDAMDNVMYEHLKVDQKQGNGVITFYIDGLTLKQAPKDKTSPYLFDARGRLVVAGVTNKISMPVKVLPLADKQHRIKISGVTTIKMTDYKVEPPAPKIAFGVIKTGDDVKVIFKWLVAPIRAG